MVWPEPRVISTKPQYSQPTAVKNSHVVICKVRDMQKRTTYLFDTWDLTCRDNATPKEACRILWQYSAKGAKGEQLTRDDESNRPQGCPRNKAISDGRMETRPDRVQVGGFPSSQGCFNEPEASRRFPASTTYWRIVSNLIAGMDWTGSEV